MRAGAALCVVLGFSAGCVSIEEEYRCTSPSQCVRDGESGSCETPGFCAFVDAACPVTGQRYGEHAGELSQQCVVRGGMFWVSPDGDDEGPGTEAQPFQTITRGVRDLVAGDAVLVKPGIYQEAVHSIPPGASWEELVRVIAWPRRGATLLSPEQEVRPLEFGDPTRFVSVEGFVIDGTGGIYEPVKSYMDHIRIQDCEITRSPVVALFLSAYPDAAGHCELLDLDIHGNGTAQLGAPGGPTGGIAIGTASNLVDGCRIHDNIGGGLIVYAGMLGLDENVVRNTVVSNPIPADLGIFVTNGARSLIYNNVVYNAGGGGIRVDYGAEGTLVLHNTVYTPLGISIGVETSDVLVANNIVFEPGGTPGFIDHMGPGGISSNNFTDDPRFVDADAADFHLRPDSPAIDFGTEAPQVPVDFDGVPRPQGAAYDPGAFELR